MSYDPNLIYNKLIETGADWADKKSAFMLLDDMTKTVLADVIVNTDAKSMAERTEMAKADSYYKAHLKGLGEARKAYLHAEVIYKSMQALADARRTEASTRRAEAKLAPICT